MPRPRKIWSAGIHTVGLHRTEGGDHAVRLGLELADGPEAGRQVTINLEPGAAIDLGDTLAHFADRATAEGGTPDVTA